MKHTELMTWSEVSDTRPKPAPRLMTKKSRVLENIFPNLQSISASTKSRIDTMIPAQDKVSTTLEDEANPTQKPLIGQNQQNF